MATISEEIIDTGNENYENSNNKSAIVNDKFVEKSIRRDFVNDKFAINEIAKAKSTQQVIRSNIANDNFAVNEIPNDKFAVNEIANDKFAEISIANKIANILEEDESDNLKDDELENLKDDELENLNNEDNNEDTNEDNENLEDEDQKNLEDDDQTNLATYVVTIDKKIRNSIRIYEDTPSEQTICLNGIKLPKDYLDPYAGDIIQLIVKSTINVDTDEEEEIIVAIEPEERNSDVGKITEFDGKKGLIDGIHMFDKFAFSMSDRNSNPQVGQVVDFVAIGTAENDYFCDSSYSRCIQISYKNDSNVNDTEDTVVTTDETENGNKKRQQYGEKRYSGKKRQRRIHVSPDIVKFIFKSIDQTQNESYVLENVSDQVLVLRNVGLIGKDKCFECQIDNPSKFENVQLKPNDTLEIPLMAKSIKNGNHAKKICFRFDGFTVSAKIYANVFDITLPVEHCKNKLYTEHVYTILNQKGIILSERTMNRTVAKYIAAHEIPEELKGLVLEVGVKHKDILQKLKDEITIFAGELTFNTYVDWFHYSLYLDEIEKFHQLRSYDQDKAQFIKETYKDEECLALMIENLAERRPSLCIGDKIIITPPDTEETTKYEGKITKIKQDRILLKFYQDFHTDYNGEIWKAVFDTARTNVRKQHEAVERSVARLSRQYFFPTECKLQAPTYDVVLKDGQLVLNDGTESIHYSWFNTLLNESQKQTIVTALRGEVKPLPFVIYGPPGTGKTITLVELILQIVQIDSNARILVGTPSNSSTELITQRLLEQNQKISTGLRRLISFNLIEQNNVPEPFGQFCLTADLGKENLSINSVSNNFIIFIIILCNCKYHYHFYFAINLANISFYYNFCN